MEGSLGGMGSYTLDSLSQKVEKLVEDLMREAGDFGSNEWEISGNLCKELCKIFGYGKNNERRTLEIKNTRFGESIFAMFDAYTFHGKAEQKFGDIIGLIVFEDSEDICGIGFFSWETKRIFYPSYSLESFRLEQLERILSFNLFAKYLIYDTGRLTIGVVNPRILLFNRDKYSNALPASEFYAYTVDFPTYFCRTLLMGNDMMMFYRYQGKYAYMNFPHKTKREVVDFFIDRVKTFNRSPSYLIMGAQGKGIEPKKALDFMQEISEALELTPIEPDNNRLDNNGPDDFPGRDPSGLSP